MSSGERSHLQNRRNPVLSTVICLAFIFDWVWFNLIFDVDTSELVHVSRISSFWPCCRLWWTLKYLLLRRVLIKLYYRYYYYFPKLELPKRKERISLSLFLLHVRTHLHFWKRVSGFLQLHLVSLIANVQRPCYLNGLLSGILSPTCQRHECSVDKWLCKTTETVCCISKSGLTGLTQQHIEKNIKIIEVIIEGWIKFSPDSFTARANSILSKSLWKSNDQFLRIS